MGDSPCFAIPHSYSPSAFQHPHQFSGNVAQQRLHRNMDAPRSTLKRKPSEDIDSPMPSSGPPSPSGSNSDTSNNELAKVKRVRTTAELLSKKKTVNKLIAPLTPSQLVNLISTLVEGHPFLLDDIANLVPRPTVATVQLMLATLETKLQQAFPYTKWGPCSDDYSFNRVKPALEELVETLVDYTNHFTSPPEFPTTSFAFLHIATEFCHRLPNWDNAINNEHKTNLYKTLEEFWIKAIQDASSKLEEGKIYGQMTVQEWAKNLEHHNITSQGMFSAAIEEFKTKLGWIIGIQVPTTNFSNSLSTGSPQAGYGARNLSNNNNNNDSNNNNNGSLNSSTNSNNSNGGGVGSNPSEGAGSPYHRQHHSRQHTARRNVGLGFHSRR
ncbi:Tethering factor for nuclear proteasome sts1 [Mortierella polycephala]|uniref:Tethering factor for nuclear proteasome STS1 n=1 Tax=Mortierella polycephala TaxID=41804 RepID=A0A9P6PHD5_9FUNG|nr:Tethering factor for nuclear proteasome sts1 [Mortierella polycephala]